MHAYHEVEQLKSYHQQTPLLRRPCAGTGASEVCAQRVRETRRERERERKRDSARTRARDEWRVDEREGASERERRERARTRSRETNKERPRARRRVAFKRRRGVCRVSAGLSYSGRWYHEYLLTPYIPVRRRAMGGIASETLFDKWPRLLWHLWVCVRACGCVWKRETDKQRRARETERARERNTEGAQDRQSARKKEGERERGREGESARAKESE